MFNPLGELHHGYGQLGLTQRDLGELPVNKQLKAAVTFMTHNINCLAGFISDRAQVVPENERGRLRHPFAVCANYQRIARKSDPHLVGQIMRYFQ